MKLAELEPEPRTHSNLGPKVGSVHRLLRNSTLNLTSQAFYAVFHLLAVVILALAFAGIYLFEENSFLRAQQANPRLTRQPGSLTEELLAWDSANTFAMITAILAWQYLCKSEQPALEADVQKAS